MIPKTTTALFALAAVGLAQPTVASAHGDGGGGGHGGGMGGGGVHGGGFGSGGASTEAMVASMAAPVSRAMV